jgi:hypothetical protein
MLWVGHQTNNPRIPSNAPTPNSAAPRNLYPSSRYPKPNKAENETSTTATKGPANPGDFWTLSDKIAVWVIIVGGFQFFALIGTIEVMRRTAKRQLRAYVLPESSSLFEGNMLTPPRPDQTNVPGIVMLIKNSGQTPAYKVASYAQLGIFKTKDVGPQLVVPHLTGRFSNTVGANCTFNKALWFNRALTPAEITDIYNGVQAIYLWGRIEYEDIFKNRHISNFRLHYMGLFPPPPGVAFNFGDERNEAS